MKIICPNVRVGIAAIDKRRISMEYLTLNIFTYCMHILYFCIRKFPVNVYKNLQSLVMYTTHILHSCIRHIFDNNFVD